MINKIKAWGERKDVICSTDDGIRESNSVGDYGQLIELCMCKRRSVILKIITVITYMSNTW